MELEEEYLCSQCDAEAWEEALKAKRWIQKRDGSILSAISAMREAVRRWYTGERQEWEDDAVECAIDK